MCVLDLAGRGRYSQGGIIPWGVTSLWRIKPLGATSSRKPSPSAKAEPSEFFVVVPATPVMEMVQGAESVPVVGGPSVVPSSPAHARELAQQRLDKALIQLRRVGANVDG